MIMTKEKEDRATARLERTVQVYHRALLWTLEYCRYDRQGKDTSTLPAFRLDGWDMKAIHVYLGKVIRRLGSTSDQPVTIRPAGNHGPAAL